MVASSWMQIRQTIIGRSELRVMSLEFSVKSNELIHYSVVCQYQVPNAQYLVPLNKEVLRQASLLIPALQLLIFNYALIIIYLKSCGILVRIHISC